MLLREFRPFVLFVLICALGAMTLRLHAAGKPGSGYPDKIFWRGVTWDVKTSSSAAGPGPNIFDKTNVWTDGNGYLHLRSVKNASGKWTAAEIIGPKTNGYGTYTFMIDSRVDILDPNVVLGLFTWSDKARYANRELDIEFARWGDPTDTTNAHYVVQPYDAPNHLFRFAQPAETATTHRFTWRRGRVDFDSYATGGLIDSYSYTGSDVPPSGDERVRLTFWLYGGRAPLNGSTAEVVIRSFTFTP